MIFLNIPITMFFYLLGGQTAKWTRPAGVALSIFGFYLIGHLHAWASGLPSLLYGCELAFGYGEKSLFHKIAKGDDEEIRLLYSIWCCIPVIITVFVMRHWLATPSILFILGAFQLRAGAMVSFKLFGRQLDVLWEDVARGFSIALAETLALN